jgi:hypothetical protein
MQEDSSLPNFQKRKEKIRSFVLWGAINLSLGLYLFMIVATFWKFKGGCIEALDWWLFGYLVI